MGLKSVLAIAAVTVSALSGSAFAEVSFPTGFNATYSGAGFFVAGQPGGFSSIDGTDGTFIFFNAGAAQTMTLTVSFAGATNAPSPVDFRVNIYGTNILSAGPGSPSVTLNTVTWQSAGGTAFLDVDNNSIADDVAYTFAQGDDIKVANTSDPTNFTTTGSFDPNAITSLVLTFTVTTLGGGEYIGFDAIANPEPATMALFGLGALGLGGFAWRRRRARPVAKSAS